MQPERKKQLMGYACGLSAAVLRGFHAVVIRILINQGVNPAFIGAMRLFSGSLVLALLVGCLSAAKKKSFPRIPYSPFFWLISISIGVNFLLFHKGLQYTIASNAVLLQAFAPVMVLILIMLFIPQRMGHLLKKTSLPRKILQVVIVGSIGSSLLLINDPKDLLITNDAKVIGDIIEFIAMFAWALVMLGMHEYQKREPGHDSLAATAQFLFVGGLVMTPFVPWTQMGDISSIQWFWILVLGVFSTGISYALWHLASKYLDVFPLMTIFNFGSVFNVATETMVLGLKFTWKLIAGGFLILYAAIHAEIINAKYKLVDKEENQQPSG